MNHSRSAWSGFVASFVFIFTITGCSSLRLSDGTQKQTRTSKKERSIATDADDVVAIMKAWVVDSSDKVEGGFITRADEIERLRLMSAKTIDQPWSGTYWPDRVGGVAAHYRLIGQTAARFLQKPEKNYKKFTKRHNRYWRDYAKLTENEIGVLSPAEKYDLLVGDHDFTFTRRVWEGINQQNKAYDGLAVWSGICNGWTSSSIELNRPRRSVYAKAPDGKVIPFYPDDLKALASVLWAHNRIFDNTTMADGTPAMVNYGMRCDQKKPKRRDGQIIPLQEGEFARSADECRDLNPGVFHLATVNRIGVQGKGYVMDKDYNKTVNNHVVYGYDYKYYQPRKGKVGSLNESKLEIKDYKDDPFAKQRHPRARWIVGVEMDIKYMGSDYSVNGKSTDDESDDRTDVMKVKYDLELAEDNTVVGGQWRINTKQREGLLGNYGFQKPKFPDFIWYYRLWTYADSELIEDPTLENHDWANQPIPEVLRERAKAASKSEWLFGTLADRVYDSPMDDKIRKEAAKFSDQYDEEFKNTLTQERIDQLNAQLNEWHAKLDKMGVPRSKPYVQPLGRIVYSLFAAAKEKDPNPKPAPMQHGAPTEEEEDN